MKYFKEKTDSTRKGRKLMASMSDGEMRELFPHLYVLPGSGARERMFTQENTFFLFLWQVLSMSSCAEAVQRALLRLSLAGRGKASPSSSAYCQARGRIPEGLLGRMLSSTAGALEAKVDKHHLWRGRNVKIVDGTCVSMPDTPENQGEYPQPTGQKSGCGFPIMRILAVFSLATGALLSYAKGSLGTGETTMLRKITSTFSPGDIMLADRGFCSFATIAGLMGMSVDILVRMREKTIKNYMVVRKLGKDDFLIKWIRPASLGRERRLPDEICLRMVRYKVEVRGFRTKSITVLTTLTDHILFPAESFAELYLRRWYAEINLRHLKTTIGMDILKCLAPGMIGRELAMHLIAYNLIRDIMFQVASAHSMPVKSISFKYSMTIIRQWTPWFPLCNSEKQRKYLRARMFLYIAESAITERPFRREPRAVKRRPKPYQFMTSPRHVFIEIQHVKKYSKIRLT
jgi:hypothetical protein